jgi:hypothetical protein
VLAYAGASLPLLLLLTADTRGISEIVTSEFLAQEIVRSIVATLGLIAALSGPRAAAGDPDSAAGPDRPGNTHPAW